MVIFRRTCVVQPVRARPHACVFVWLSVPHAIILLYPEQVIRCFPIWMNGPSSQDVKALASGVDEPPLELSHASMSPAIRLTICRLVGLLNWRLCLVTVAEHFHHCTLGGSLCNIAYNGSKGRGGGAGRGRGGLPHKLLPFIMAEVLSWVVGWRVLTERTVMYWSHFVLWL